MTKTFGSSMIVSDAFLSHLSDAPGMLPHRRALGMVNVKGRSEAVALHEVFEFDAPDLVAHKEKTRAAFEQAQLDFQAKLYAETIAALGPILRAHPGDAAASPPARGGNGSPAGGCPRAAGPAGECLTASRTVARDPGT
jgi:hypothetical protein